MALTREEEIELAQLEKELAPKAIKTSALSPSEESELAQLNSELSVPQDKMLANNVNSGRGARYKEAALQGVGQAATLGYLPQIQAATRKPLEWIYEKVTGEDVPDKSYVQARDRYIKKDIALSEEAPKSYLGGQITGTVLSALAPGAIAGRIGKGAQVAKSLSTANKVKEAAKYGALTGLLQNPGDVEGEVSPVQLAKRVENSAKGAAIGGGAQAAASLIGKGLKMYAGKGKGLEKASNMMAVQAAGAKTSEINKLYNKNAIDRVGKFLKDEGLVGPGKTVEDTLSGAAKILDTDGQEIADIYKRANIRSLAPKQLAQEMDDLFTKELKGKAGGRRALSAIQGELENLKDLGDDAPLEQVLAFRRGIDDLINYDKSISDMPVVQQTMKKVRDFIKDKLDKEVAAVDPADLERLKVLNKRYWNASDAESIAKRAMSRENAKMVLGLPELIVGTGYGATEYGKNPEDFLGSVAKGALAGAALKGARKFGPGLMVKGAELSGKALQADPMGPVAGLLGKNIDKIPAKFLGYAPNVINNKNKKSGK